MRRTSFSTKFSLLFFVIFVALNVSARNIAREQVQILPQLRLLNNTEKLPLRRENNEVLPTLAPPHYKDLITWSAYQPYVNIVSYLQDLALNYPRICSLQTIGKTHEGRQLLVLRIGDDSNTNKIWIDGGIHAREWISPAAVTYIINDLVINWSKHPQYIRDITWYIMPVANPDGYLYSWKDGNRLWRKNRRNNGTCNGVDLNRNFGFMWAGIGANPDPCTPTYRGPSAFSEPESIAISTFLLNNRPIAAYLTYHSYGQYILYSYGYNVDTLSSDHENLRRVGRKAASKLKTEYAVLPAYKIGAAAGGSDDWAKAVLKVNYSYTIELRDQGTYGFELPPEQILGTSEEALLIAFTIAEAVASDASQV